MTAHDPNPSDSRLARLAALAASQGGLITRRQALDAGLKEHHLRYRVDTGLLTPVSRGLFHFTAVAVGREQRLVGALLLAGAGAAVSHRTAAILHGTREFSGEILEVTMPVGRKRQPPGVIVHRSRSLVESHVTRIDGVRVTTTARTLVDLAASQPRARLTRILEEWLADRKVSAAAVRTVLADLGTAGRAEACAVRDLLDGRVLGDEPGDSTDDSLLGQLIQDRGLPVPEHNYLVYVDGEWLELDWAYPAELLTVEVNGFSVHTRSRRNYERELLKQRLLATTSWMLLQYTADMVRRQPDRVVNEVETHRRARAAVPPAP